MKTGCPMARPSGRKRLMTLLRPYLVAAAGFSVALNILALVSPIYMLQVYDRVLTTGSLETLILLSAIAVFLLVIFLFAEAGRRRVLARAAQALSDGMARETLDVGFHDPRRSPAEILQTMTSLNRLQGALHQGLPAPLLDLPFVPAFLLIMFLVHPVVGLIATGGAVALVLLALLTEALTKEPLAEANEAENAAEQELRQLVRQRGAIAGMGMGQQAMGRWFSLRQEGVEQTLGAGTPATFLGAATRSLRMILQVAVLGGGAWLAIRGDVSPGAIIASSIIMGRALAPIDQTVNAWRQIVGVRRSLNELSEWTSAARAQGALKATPMPPPEPQLHLEELEVSPPGGDRALLQPIDHQFPHGQMVALVGPSGAGKTSILQTVASAWSPHAGSVRLGGRDFAHWPLEDRGRSIGYLPQHVELLRGTIRENITRFTDAPNEKLYAAARMAGCERLIERMGGYDVEIGESGRVLSAGQRQAIGLARAFFGNPPLLILDEPTAHLDAEMQRSFYQTIFDAAQRPAQERTFTALIATHDFNLIRVVNDVWLLNGRQHHLSDSKAYVARVQERQRQARPTGVVPRGALTVDISQRSDNG